MPNKRLIIGIFLMFAANAIQAFFTPISEDEAYYWLWSQNLDWGYFDHPPMIAWWISPGYEIFHNELGVRILTVLLNSFGFFFLWKILQPENQKQIKLFWMIFVSLLVIQVFGFLATPDAPLLFFTILYFYSLKNFLKKNSLLFTFLLAVSFAGLMYSKYHGILVILFTLVPILKNWWKNPKFYIAVSLSIVLYLPHIFWLIQHDFVPIRYHFFERSSDEHFELRKLTNYLGIYFLGAAPLLSYFIFSSIFKFKAQNPFQKSIWWLTILPGIFFFLSIFKDNVQPQWLLISFIAMALIMYFHYSGQENLNLIFRFGFTGIILIFILRVLLMIPGISPIYKNKHFGLDAGRFRVENAVFEKYQEASVYKFYNPDRSVAVHRTLGNRHSQFSLWGWEENFYGEKVTYISPWVKAENSFKGYKNREYFLKEIADYQTYDLIKIETVDELNARPGELIRLKIKIKNGHSHPVTIGGNSEFQMNISYYKDLQYEIVFSYGISATTFTLQAGEEKELNIQFKNTPKKGVYKACIGIRYSETGTAYLSKPISVLVN